MARPTDGRLIITRYPLPGWLGSHNGGARRPASRTSRNQPGAGIWGAGFPGRSWAGFVSHGV